MTINAQNWVDKFQDVNENFYSIQSEFNSYWSSKSYERGKGYKQFKRWEWMAEPRVYPSGDLKYASRAKAYEEFQNYLLANPTAVAKISSVSSTSGNWTAIGPFGSPVGGDAGRITFIRFMPGLPSTVFAGTGAGGLWVSTNSGTSWTTNTNSLSVLGCSDLAINPLNTNIMYLAMGDIDASDTKSTGVLKSINGGLTWSTTGLTFSVSLGRTIGRLLINPLNPNVVLAATSVGIYRTNNAGVTWNVVKTGSYKDIEYKTTVGDTTNVFAVTASTFVRSVNGGNTFTTTATGLPGTTVVNRMALSVTAADPNYIYILCSKSSDNGFGGVYRSVDGGVTFTLRSSTPNIFDWSTTGSGSGGQGWYDIACGVSPTNKNEIICGGVNSWKSINGGSTWTLNSHWTGGGGKPYVHADLHSVEYVNGTTCYMGHDGGVSKTTNSGATWTTINGTMNIAQSYKIGQSAQAGTPNYVISGHQDNGTNLWNGGVWTEVYGGDGADCFVDWSTNATLVESYVQGDFNRSTNSGGTWTAITSGITGTAAWVAPIIQDPNNANIFYGGYQQVFKSLNKGTAWTQMGTIAGSGDVLSIAAAPSSTATLYASRSTNIYKTTNSGTTWASITTGLPTSLAQITNIAVDNLDATNVFVTFSGYSAGNKVFVTTNGGSTWTNISAGLPNLPVNCIIYTKNLNDAIYVGTDVGVYFKDGSMTSFIPFMTNLPNVIVNDFEIHYATNKLRAGTYGRGVWESDLYSNPLAPPNASFSTAFTSACVGIPFVISDQSSGTPTAWTWTLTGGSPAISSVKNPTVTYSSAGVYTVSFVSTNINGNSTVYTNTILVSSPPVLVLTTATVCSGMPATISASGATSYLWSGGGGTSASILVTPTVTSVYTCTGYVGACSSVKSTTVIVGSYPTAPTITQSGQVLTSSAATGNQWYLNGSIIVGATGQTYTVTADGYYSVWVTTLLGCQASSTSYQVLLSSLNELLIYNAIVLGPNPAKNYILLTVPAELLTVPVSIKCIDVTGKIVIEKQLVFNSTSEKINIENLANGIYVVEFKTNTIDKKFKFVKE
jgi:PKD repeat protein